MVVVDNTVHKGDTVLYSVDAGKQYKLGYVNSVSENGRFTLVVGIDKTIHTVYTRDCIVIYQGVGTL